jgi:hypothetical protein
LFAAPNKKPADRGFFITVRFTTNYYDDPHGDEESYYFAMLAIAHVHGNFKAKTHFSSSWFGPHDVSP